MEEEEREKDEEKDKDERYQKQERDWRKKGQVKNFFEKKLWVGPHGIVA